MELDYIDIKLVAFDTSTMNKLGRFLKSKAGKEAVSAVVRHLRANTPARFPDDWPDENRTRSHMELLVLKGKKRHMYEMTLQNRVS